MFFDWQIKILFWGRINEGVEKPITETRVQQKGNIIVVKLYQSLTL